VTFARQTGWSGCIARLLVKEVIQPEADSVVSVEDVISLEDDQETADQVRLHKNITSMIFFIAESNQ
jgi:hypothetical protein